MYEHLHTNHKTLLSRYANLRGFDRWYELKRHYQKIAKDFAHSKRHFLKKEHDEYVFCKDQSRGELDKLVQVEKEQMCLLATISEDTKVFFLVLVRSSTFSFFLSFFQRSVSAYMFAYLCAMNTIHTDARMHTTIFEMNDNSLLFCFATN